MARDVLSHADLAELCCRAYRELSGVARDLEFFISTVGDTTYIAIRGTERCLRDITRNLRIIPRRTKATGMGHGGFVRGAVAVARALQSEIPDGNHVVITGHSLGAAVAVLVSQILHKQQYTVEQVVLFGCPRVYLLKRPVFDYPVVSYRHGKDIVSGIPRWPYRHAVELTRIGDLPRWSNWSIDHPISAYEKTLRALGL